MVWRGCWARLLAPEETRFTVFVFGSAAALRREQGRVARAPYCVIHPYSPFRKFYVVFMFGVSVLTLLTTPIGLAFGEELDNLYGMFIFNLVSDGLFLIDLILNFRLGVITGESELAILDLKLIRKIYLRSWFVPDFLSALPTDFIIIILKSSTIQHTYDRQVIMQVVQVVLIARVLKLLRIVRMKRYIEEWDQLTDLIGNTSYIIFEIVLQFGILYMVVHWNACIQFYTEDLLQFPVNSWVYQQNLTNAWWVEQYSFSVFRALSHMLSIGYGSANPPTGVAEVWVTITSAVSGYLLYMSVIANVAAQLSHADPTANAYRDKMNDIQEYMSYRKLPQDLCQRIFTYYDIRYQGRWYNEEEILNEMSEPLKEEVKHHLCARLVKKVPLFKHCDLNFLNAVIMYLNIELFQPGEVIIVEGSYGDRMYFLEYGRVLMKSKSMTKELKAGDYFGEIFPFKECARSMTVTALTVCRLFSLPGDKLKELLEAYPEIGEEIMKCAIQSYESLTELEAIQQNKM